MPRRTALRGLAAAAAILLVAAGCAGRPGASPSTVPIGVQHATGAEDLILRVFVGGGFVPPGFIVTEAPAFSLYGDGTLIYRDLVSPLPSPVNGVAQGAPFRTVKLSESAVHALLTDALVTGGLQTAEAQYVLPIADAPTTSFTIDANGVSKQVDVNGLGLVQPSTTDAAALNALAALRDRLLAYGPTVSGSQPWQPVQYRAYLLDVSETSTVPIAWPWSTFTPATWTNVSDESSSLPYPTRRMSREDVQALGLGPLAGGATGIVVSFSASNPTLYGVSLRPLLPDETAG